MKIGIIGSGNIGGTVGTLWTHAGHDVMFSSRKPGELRDLVAHAGARALSGTPEQAARFGEAVLVSIPFKALSELGRALAPLLQGKVVLETSNPYPERDGALAKDVLDSGRGTGPFVAGWFMGARIVRAFNSVWYRTLRSEAHRKPPRVGIPIASDDPEAIDAAATLVREAGFEPMVGNLDTAREFDTGSAVYNTGMSGPELRKALRLSQAA